MIGQAKTIQGNKVVAAVLVSVQGYTRFLVVEFFQKR